MFLSIIFNLAFNLGSIKLMCHPLEKRIAYVYGIKDIKNIPKSDLLNLQLIFQIYPLLIFKELNTDITPQDFFNFVQFFDINHDKKDLNLQHQMLQPFDQFPECKHVAPRGNIELNNFYNIKPISIAPYDPFINNYVWHSDIIGHEYKLPNVVTGFYIIEQPLIGGDTDFISGETVYENLSLEEQIASKNMLIEINRRKFLTKTLEFDYAGVNRLEEFSPRNDGNTQIPLVFAPEELHEKPKVLIMPTFFERVVGWSIEMSRKWINYFMNNKVLPHRVSIQWKKGDLAVFNNRRFMHSSTPARNYLDNLNSNKRLLLQTFIPTNKPLMGIKPNEKDVYACYNLNWIDDQEVSIISTHDHIKFVEKKEVENNYVVDDDNHYIICKKKENLLD